MGVESGESIEDLGRSLKLDDRIVRRAIAVFERTTSSGRTAEDRSQNVERVVVHPAKPGHPDWRHALHASLFPYQRQVVQDALRDLLHSRARKALVAMPTGAGKTRTAIGLLLLATDQAPVRSVLWVAPSRELVKQAHRTTVALHQAWGIDKPIQVGPYETISMSSTDRSRTSVEFGTLQLLHRRSAAAVIERYDMVVFDEAHLYTGTMGQRIADAVAHKKIPLLGLTATPGKTDEKASWDFASMFENKAIVPASMRDDPIGFLEEAGVRARVQERFIDLPPVVDDVRVTSLSGPRIAQSSLAADPYRFEAVIDAVGALPDESYTIVFAGSIAHAVLISTCLAARGVTLPPITYRTSARIREKILDEFRKGAIRGIVNKNIVTTGVDLPGATDAFLTVPIRSAVQWEQILGRVTRGPSVGGTESATVWQFDDHRKMHESVLSFQRFASNYV